MKRIKILYVYNALARFAGTERIIVNKMNYLVNQNNYDIHLVTTDQGKHEIAYDIDHRIKHKDLGIRFHSIYSYPIYKRIFKYLHLKKVFKERLEEYIINIKPDIIVCIADMFVDTIIKFKLNIPIIVESHMTMAHTAVSTNSKYKLFHIIKRYIYFRYLQKATYIVTITQGDALEWSTIHKSVIVIPNIVNLYNKEIDTEKKNKVIFVGRFEDQKGIGDLIKIWEKVHQQYPEWTLDLYGQGTLREKYEQVINGFEDCLNIIIHDPTKDIFEKYLESSIFVLTSVFEPFGLVIPEAMSCGLPIVSYNCPYGPSNIINNNQDGFLIEPGNIKDFTSKIIYLIENKEQRILMGKAAIEKSKKYSAERIMPIWTKLFNSLVNKNQTL